MKRKIVWGTCWFNEKIETLISFLLESTKTLSSLNFEVIPIVFEAKLEHNNESITLIKSKIKNVIILQNNYSIFPNKNYGVALITNKAKELNIPYTAIVDCDWDIKECSCFMNNTILSLINEKNDIVIPNIGDAAGRSNILIGKTIINLLYPEYKDILITPFPGSIVGKTSKLYKIINSKNYHYDWGGEWDIISLAIKNKMKINSYSVSVDNLRHRCNLSKINDSFQIWRSVLSNIDIKRLDNVNRYNLKMKPYNEISKNILDNNYTIKEIIDIINSDNSTDTEKQLLYMIIYPISYLTGIIENLPIIKDNKNKKPYDKNELNKIFELGIYCAKKILISLDKNEIINNVSNKNIVYLSNWTQELQKEASINYNEV